ncbi:MAG: hypothetical protein H7X94_00540 [Vallitaleaceae bacterium]|nr:hypothetical protein [Vallitaleaceae bacterium]
MNVNQIAQEVKLKIVTGEKGLGREINGGFIGDLLSVVMGKATEGCAWMTIQSHFNIVAVASLVDVACIIVTEGFEVEPAAIEKANEEEIPILTTELSSYDVAKKLVMLGI